jgi:CheY-like chemotaxis protein
VLTAASAAEALAIARARRLDLIFADLQMPGLDGADLCRAVKDDPLLAGVRVVLLDGRRSAADRERAVRAGADDVIPKPLERVALLDAARRLAARPSPRGLPRVPVAIPVCLRRGAAEWRGEARNVSRGGLFVESERLAPARAELELRMQLAEIGLELAATAQVVWLRRRSASAAGGMGLRFLGLDGAAVRHLTHYVEERRAPPRAHPMELVA